MSPQKQCWALSAALLQKSCTQENVSNTDKNIPSPYCLIPTVISDSYNTHLPVIGRLIRGSNFGTLAAPHVTTCKSRKKQIDINEIQGIVCPALVTPVHLPPLPLVADNTREFCLNAKDKMSERLHDLGTKTLIKPALWTILHTDRPVGTRT